jgi:hypothetical protein
MQFKRLFLATSALLFAAASWSQAAWPTKSITLVVPFAAGGPTDVVARTLGASMSKTLGQTVVVENKLGAGGTVAAASVVRAAPDGYTFFIHHNGMATATALYRKLPYNPLTDFEFVSQAVDVPMTLLARKDFPANNFQELAAYLKANQSKINLANAGLGAVSQLCGLMLEQALGAKFTAVPFQGTAPAMNALLGGQVDILCDQTTQTIPPDQGRQREVLRGDHQVAHQGIARGADAGGAGPEGFRSGGVARHLRAQGNAETHHRPDEPGSARGPEGPGCRQAHGGPRCRDRARFETQSRRPADLAEVGDRQVGSCDPGDWNLRRLTQ